MDPRKIEVTGVTKTFKVGSQDIEVLKGIDFEIDEGEFAVIFGPSGCGKSTLLHILLGLEEPSGGSVHMFGYDLYNNTDQDDRAIYRRAHVGMVYQQANWIKALDVKENVAFPLTLAGIQKHQAFSKVNELLKSVEMDYWSNYMPSELSSGQQQRIALARAMINNPNLIVADEPTGNLDLESGEQMMLLLKKLSDEFHKTIVMVTHDLEYLKYSSKIIQMLDGKLVGVYKGEEKDKITSVVGSKRGNILDLYKDEALH